MTTTTAPARPAGFKGNDKVLAGIVLAVMTFWLFAASMGTVATKVLSDLNAGRQVMTADQMNLAVALTALFSGLFTVLAGGWADSMGRKKIAYAGLGLGVVGAILLLLANGGAALPLMIAGRALQGISAAFIMPSTMALVKTYWEGAARQRAVSMWSIGSWGGSGLSALFGGFLATNLGWRWIFIAMIVVSLLAAWLMKDIPESRAEATSTGGFDVLGLVIFMVTILALMVVVIFGRQLGWTSPAVLALAAVAVVGLIAFYLLERGKARPFIDFGLFANRTFTGATLSNFLLNSTIGLLIVSQQMLQIARPDRFNAWTAGLLTIGYAVMIIAFIRVGEKLLQKFGPRKPMIWGTIIVGLAGILLALTHLLVGAYAIVAAIAYSLFGLGLAFYATPSTDAALSNLPADQAGKGAGIYKMASSLGSAMGAAMSLALFTALAGGGFTVLGDFLHLQGVTYNGAVRQAGAVTMLFNVVLTAIALLSIILTVPKGKTAEK